MFLNEIIDKYTEIVNSYEHEEAVRRITADIAGSQGFEKAAKIEALARLTSFLERKTHYLKAKISNLEREIERLKNEKN